MVQLTNCKKFWRKRHLLWVQRAEHCEGRTGRCPLLKWPSRVLGLLPDGAEQWRLVSDIWQPTPAHPSNQLPNPYVEEVNCSVVAPTQEVSVPEVAGSLQKVIICWWQKSQHHADSSWLHVEQVTVRSSSAVEEIDPARTMALYAQSLCLYDPWKMPESTHLTTVQFFLPFWIEQDNITKLACWQQLE